MVDGFGVVEAQPEALGAARAGVGTYTRGAVEHLVGAVVLADADEQPAFPVVPTLLAVTAQQLLGRSIHGAVGLGLPFGLDFAQVGFGGLGRLAAPA